MGSTPPLTQDLQFSVRPRNGCQTSCRTQKALEIYSVLSSTALFAVFSFQHSTAACLCWPSLPTSLPPHLRAIGAQEIQYYLKYLTKGLSYSLGRGSAHDAAPVPAGRRCVAACFVASELPQATESLHALLQYFCTNVSAHRLPAVHCLHPKPSVLLRKRLHGDHAGPAGRKGIP